MIDKGLVEVSRLTTTQRDAISLSANDAAVIFNTTTGFLESWDGSAWVRLSHSLAIEDQTLTGRREIVTNGATDDLRLIGLEQNSDRQSAHVLTIESSNNSIKRRVMESILVDVSATAGPTDGVTTAYYDGYLHINTQSRSLWRANNKSTDPDVSPAGSTWVKLVDFYNYTHDVAIGDWSAPSGGERTLSITGAAHGRGTDLIVQAFEITGGTNANMIVPQGITYSTATGDITITVVDGQEFAGRIVVRG